MAHTMPATHETNVPRVLLISVIVVALLLVALALGLWLWPGSEEATMVELQTPSAQVQSTTAAERTLITPVHVGPHSVTAAERDIVSPVPMP